MAKDKTLLPTGNWDGSGSQTLGFNWGKNQGRTKITHTYTLTATGAVVGNSMRVEQAYAPLSITVLNGESTKTVTRASSSTASTVSFSGACNGRQMQYTSLSNQIIVTSCSESSGSQAASVGTSWGSVSNFQGGSSTYGWLMSFNIPAGVPDGNYNLADITTRDSTNALTDNKRLAITLVTEGAPTPTPSGNLSVSISPNPVVIGVGATRQLSYVASPASANITSATWSVTNSSIATIDARTGVLAGVADGQTTIQVTIKDSSNNTAVGSCQVRVYAAGTISGTSTEYSGTYETAQAPLSLYNMNVSTLSVSWPSSVTWISSGQVMNNGSSYYVFFNTYKNTDTSNSRSAAITVSGKDMLGDTKSCLFTLTQLRYYLPCTGMSIGGDSAINNSGNSAEYTAAYTPSGTTQNNCVWSVTTGSQYVTLDTSLGANLCVVNVEEGASNQTVRLVATNSSNGSISAYKDITVTYVYNSGNIEASSYDNRISAIDTYLDDTNGAPYLTFTDIEPGTADIYATTGFIDSAVLKEASSKIYLCVTFTRNSSSSSRSGSVQIVAMDLNNDPVYATIGYTQAGKQSSTNAIVIDSFTVRQAGGKVEATATVRYRNRSDVSTFFLSPVLRMGGDRVISITVANVTNVAAGSDFSVTYDKTDYAQMSWTGIVGTSYTLKVVSDSVESETVNATIIDD